MHLFSLDQFAEQTNTTIVSKMLGDNMTIYSQFNRFKKVMTKSSCNNYISAV